TRRTLTHWRVDPREWSTKWRDQDEHHSAVAGAGDRDRSAASEALRRYRIRGEASDRLTTFYEHNDQFTASRSPLPALKPGTLAAAILRVAPVAGLRPSRAARSFTTKLPKPTRFTLSPA